MGDAIYGRSVYGGESVGNNDVENFVETTNIT